MKRKSELVIVDGKVYHLGVTPNQIAPNIFLVGDPARAYRVSNTFERVHHEVCHREYVTLTGTYRGIDMSVIGTGIGTDNVEIALVEAYNALCFDLDSGMLRDELPKLNVIRIGTSGGVQPHLAAGTLAISSHAIGLDSTGLFYDHPPVSEVIEQIEEACYQLLTEHTPPDARFKGKIIPYAAVASPSIVNTMRKTADAMGITHCTGITVASPGFYGPSGRFVQGLINTIPDIKLKLAALHINDLQVVNMEMESSLIFHICAHLGISCGTVCPIISNPTSSTEIVDYHAVVGQAIEIGLATMVKITEAEA